MTAWQWNGDVFAQCDSVPLSDRGFRYGMSIFETVRVSAGGPHFLPEHLERLRGACHECNLDCDPRALSGIEELLRGEAREAVARIYITAGDGAPAAPAKDPRTFVFVETRVRHAAAAFDLVIGEWVFQPPFPGLKTGNYWANVRALAQAQARGKHEALLFNASQQLVSACCANVFVVQTGTVRTPSLSCGARAGVMREQVMQRVAVEECTLSRDDVLCADEIFLTSSWLGVMPAGRVDGRELASREVSAGLARTLNR